MNKTLYKERDNLLEVHLSAQDSLYLIRQRIDNLRQKIKISFDELLEFEELLNITEVFDSDELPKNLGIPSKIDKFIAALESKRVNRYNSEEYDGGDIGNAEESNIDQYYHNLLKESWLNKKSVKILSAKKTTVFYNSSKYKKVTVFDIFEKSSIHQVLQRCAELVISPIYDGMASIGNEQYSLSYGIELRFTDKTAIFTIPLEQFFDLPKTSKKRDINETPAYIEVAFILPFYSHEKKRYFKKGATLEDVCKYLEKAGGDLPANWIDFLYTLKENRLLRIYWEMFDNRDDKKVRAYFLNITGGYQNGQWFSKQYIENCLRKRLKKD